MGRHTWNVAELSELIAAFQEREYSIQDGISKRIHQKMGDKHEKELLGPDYMQAAFARQSVHVAQRLIEDDRTVPLNYLSEEEIRRVAMDMLQEFERRDGDFIPPEMRSIMLNVVVQQVQQVFNPKDSPATSYEATWQWIDMIDTWAIEHDRKPLAFFDQPDAYEQITRHTKSKEMFLEERRKRCDPESNAESMKAFFIEPLLALIQDEHEREEAKKQILAEASETLSAGIAKRLQALYAEYVAEADRIYGPSEPALPA